MDITNDGKKITRDDVKNANRKDFIKKGFKSQEQHAKNEIVQTIQSNAINDSAYEHHNNGYNKHEYK